MASKASKRAVEEDLANVEFETSEDVEVNISRTKFIPITSLIYEVLNTTLNCTVR